MRHKDLGPKGPWPEKAAISRLRLLDFDDLYLLSHLLEGQTIAATAKQLGLTQPAITQRVRKIERVFDEPLLVKVGRHVRLTREGRAICLKAAEALSLMQEASADASTRHLAVACDPDLLRLWLGRAVIALRADADPVALHALTAGEEEWPLLLESGQIDAALTLRLDIPATALARTVGEVESVIVAAPALAARLGEPGVLEKTLLLERDRSYALAQRIEPAARSRLKLGETWFLGSEAQVMNAALEGLGIAVLPTRLVEGAVGAGRLVPVLVDTDVTPASLRLVHRVDLKDDPRIERLAQRLECYAKT